MKKLLTILFIFLLPVLSIACPNCAGSSNAQDKYTVYVLAVFILLTYIPFYMLYKTAFKHKKKD